ncbi:hypothetical protein Franean1_2405 [Parafrankia sp. EAN1pec]|nr:hypothetical protein Franean1_2405 [Frankia sp. EAN1pec]
MVGRFFHNRSGGSTTLPSMLTRTGSSHLIFVSSAVGSGSRRRAHRINGNRDRAFRLPHTCTLHSRGRLCIYGQIANTNGQDQHVDPDTGRRPAHPARPTARLIAFRRATVTGRPQQAPFVHSRP